MNQSPTRNEIARAAAKGLRAWAAAAKQTPALVGFDGFVDSIITVVDKRHDFQRFDPVKTIAQFGQKILSAAGMSSNYEFVVKLQKLGGNGPIMANALSALGLPVTYVGALGHPAIHPVFQEFSTRVETISVADPGQTDAVEFDDGKLMLGKIQTLDRVNAQTIRQTASGPRYEKIVQRSRLIAMVNWTMLPKMNSIWEDLEKVLAKSQKPRAKSEGREANLIFIDLADPEKRTVKDLQGALKLATRLQRQTNVVLGLNHKEAVQVAAALGLKIGEDLAAGAELIRAELNLYCVVIHPRNGAAGARQNPTHYETAWFAGPFVQKPKLSTGAGDNFNAGFCLGLLSGLPLEQALCAGTATSGYYVRNAASPTLKQLISFCQKLPDPQ